MIKSQNGNVLWLILLAVGLLGLLAAVISRSNSSNNQTAGLEKARIKASSVLRFGKSVQQSVQQMILNQGISENDLDFLKIDADHDNINCSSDECDIFAQNGGGISYRTPAQILGLTDFTENWHISTNNTVYQFGCDSISSDCTELLMILENVPLSVCLEINKIQKITNPAGEPPRINRIIKGNEFNGTYATTGINTDQIGGTDATNEAPEVKGKSAACVYEFGGSPASYVYYQVILER